MSGGGSPGAAADFDAVHITDVSRHYGRRRALARVTFSARAGEIVGLFGPNGSGKSTLLGVLSTLIRPTTGAVLYGERTAVALGDELRGRIGVLGHDLFLYPDLTARENLEFFARLYQVGDVGACVGRALEAARLQDRADDRVSGFSRGMRQRLALERALVHEPRLLLLDEPFTGLDDQAASLLHGRLRSVRERGTIVLMSTHDFEIADGLVDRALCLDQGRLREFGAGAGASLRERYRATLQEPLAVMGVIRTAWLIAQKDLRVEARSRELVYTTLFFALACVVIFAFAFVREGRTIENAPAGILWVAIVFSGTLALARAFERERQSETLRALLLAPGERAAVYLGKLIAVLILLAAVEVLLVPIVAVLFQAPVARAPWLLAALLATGTLGFAAVGTLFAAMLVRAQSRDVLLPVVLYPLTVPVIIGGLQGTAAIFAAEPNLEMARLWLSMLVFFDAVFVTLALWTFAPVMTE